MTKAKKNRRTESKRLKKVEVKMRAKQLQMNCVTISGLTRNDLDDYYYIKRNDSSHDPTIYF